MLKRCRVRTGFIQYILINRYGDIAPLTKIGKGLMMFYMGLATLLIAALTGVYAERVANAELHISSNTKVSKWCLTSY